MPNKRCPSRCRTHWLANGVCSSDMYRVECIMDISASTIAFHSFHIDYTYSERYWLTVRRYTRRKLHTDTDKHTQY